MVFKINIKDIKNMTVMTDGGMKYMKLRRIGPEQFEISYRSDKIWVCDKCCQEMTIATEDEHRACRYERASEEYVIDAVTELFGEDENNIVCINEGLDDQVFIHLG